MKEAICERWSVGWRKYVRREEVGRWKNAWEDASIVVLAGFHSAKDQMKHNHHSQLIMLFEKLHS